MDRLVRRLFPALTLASVGLLTVGAQPADAIPMASLTYVESGLPAGAYQYDLTLRNDSHPIDDAGADLYDLALFFSPTVTLLNVVAPTGWDFIGGAGFLDLFSANPGPLPLGTDVAPGQTLTGLSLVVDQQLGALAFQAVFTNPLISDEPFLYDGTAAAPEPPATVPEPSALLLMGTAATFSIAARRRRRTAAARFPA